jgi:carbon-monoxide dehydrogenase large subunit
MRVKTLADHGAFNAAAQPTKFPAGLFSICTGAYDYPTAFCEVDGVYTNKAPGGIAYRCYLIERAVDVLAQELKTDPVELRRKNFIPPQKFPYASPLGWSYDSGDYDAAMKVALDTIGYDALRTAGEAQERRVDGYWGFQFRRSCRRGTCPYLRYRRHQDVRQLRDSCSPHGQGHVPHGNQEPGAGA